MANQEHLDILKQGVGIWNKWRVKYPEIEPDLSRTDSAIGLLIGIDLKGANLSGTNLRDAILVGNDLFNVNLSHANLQNATLATASLHEVDLSGADLRNAQLNETRFYNVHFNDTNLSNANLNSASLSRANLIEANLSGADLTEANLLGADLTRANLSHADLRRASFSTTIINDIDYYKLDSQDIDEINYSEANLQGANLDLGDLREVNLSHVNLSNVSLRGAKLQGANLQYTNLSGVDLSGADLTGALLVHANLTNANLTGCRIYGISAWDVILENAIQKDLTITPLEELLLPSSTSYPSSTLYPGKSEITLDNLDVAQFIYLLLNNRKIRDVINTITSKVVLILGRFTDARKPVLDVLRDELRNYNYSPIVFDFEKPGSRNLTETVSTLAHLSRFIIADLTDAKSIPQELERIIPRLRVPVQSLLHVSEKDAYAMYRDFEDYHWVLPIYRYSDQDMLLLSLRENIIDPAEQKAQEIERRK